MIQVQEVPLSNNSQTFTISIDRTIYRLNIVWRSTVYVMDILDNSNNIIISGIPLVSGLDLLEQFNYLGIPREVVILSDVPYTDPIYDTLGLSTYLCLVQQV